MNLLGNMIERAMTCLTMQETREIEQVGLLLDTLDIVDVGKYYQVENDVLVDKDALNLSLIHI